MRRRTCSNASAEIDLVFVETSFGRSNSVMIARRARSNCWIWRPRTNSWSASSPEEMAEAVGFQKPLRFSTNPSSCRSSTAFLA